MAAHEELVRELVAEQSDITLAELRAVLATEKVTVGQSSISRFLHHLNLRFKKSLRAAEQGRPDVAAARKALQKQQPRPDPKRLVFIDEINVSTTPSCAAPLTRSRRSSEYGFPISYWPAFPCDSLIRFVPAGESRPIHSFLEVL